MSASNWEEVYRVQNARIAELEKENAGLLKDKERLDWMEGPGKRLLAFTIGDAPASRVCWRVEIDAFLKEGKQ